MKQRYTIIGDVHGCDAELQTLLAMPALRPTPERPVVFVGDLVDRGPATPAVLRTVMSLQQAGLALCVRGNHDDKLQRALAGRPVQVSADLQTSLDQLAALTETERRAIHAFLAQLPWRLHLDEGRLVIAHAGLRADLHNVDTPRARAFALYGDTTGDVDERGYPIRGDWAAQYRGEATVVYGHTPVQSATWKNRTLCIDTGCVFGGQLTALRYPEGDCVSVPAQRAWWPPPTP